MNKIKIFLVASALLLSGQTFAQTTKATIQGEISSSTANGLLGGTILNNIVLSYVDWTTCSGTGGIVYWNAGTPTCLNAGNNGYTLTMVSGIPQWTLPASQSANMVYAGPSSGSPATPSFRALVGSDLPNPSSSTLGGVQSAAAVSNQWINSISTSGVPSSSQPGFSNLSGQASLAQLPGIGSNTVLSNTTGGTATPLANSLSSIIDNSMGLTQGDVLYRNASGWVVLAPGAGGQVFTSGGAAANPSWTSVSGTGTVTSIATNNGITGGTITSSGTIALANITTGNVMANVSGSTTYPTPTIPSAVLDVIGSTEGSVLYRGASTWSALTPGSNGQLLATGGIGSTPSWTTPPTFGSATPGYATASGGGVVNYLRADGTWTGSNSPACVRMWPSSNFSGAWNLVDAYGTAINTAGTTTQGLQEGINYSVTHGQCMQVFGQSILQIFKGNGTTHTNTTIDAISSTTGMLNGDYVTGAGIPAFTTITNVNNSTTITISNAATASATTTITVTRGAGANRASQISATSSIMIPPFEQWSFDAYATNLTFATSVNSAGIQFDSGIIGHFGWWGGQIVYQAGTPTAASCAISITPQNNVPLDGIPAFGDNDVFIANVATPSASAAGQAVWCVSLATGSVVNNHLASNELNGTGVGATPNTTYGFSVLNPQANTSFKGNVVSITDVHLIASAGILLGGAATNQTNIADNQIIANVSPGLGGICFSVFGSKNLIEGSCRNDQAGGALAQGLTFQTGAVGNAYNISYSAGGVTTPYINNGTDNAGILNGLMQTTRLNLKSNPASGLPTCPSTLAPTGSMAVVTDSNVNTWGTSIAGGGANIVLAFCDGTGWTVAAK
jgi:hypothetical protein